MGRAPQLPEVPSAEETVRGEDDPPVVTLKIGNTLRERHLGRSDDLPSTAVVPLTNFQNVPVTAALEAVLSGTDISLSYQGNGDIEQRMVTLINLSGPLPTVVHRICSAAKIFCVARDGNLELKEQENFIIELPPVERKGGGSGAKNTIADAIGELAGSKAREDEAGGNLIYTTTVEGQERVSKYLEQLRHGRPLVVLQMYIWEVSLDSEAAAGINWKNLKTNAFGGNWDKITQVTSESTFNAATGGVSLGAVLSGKIGAQVIANFLSTQGAVQTISNPQLTFVSGSSASFRVGGTRTYVSQVGQLTSNAVSGSATGSSGVGTNTVSTAKIETGLKIEVNGSYESGVIFSTLTVSITDLIKMDSVSTGATTLQLPETTDRTFSTVLRVRPGDNIVLAGMTSSRDDLARDRLNLPIADQVPMNSDDKLQNRELVVLLKPAIVFFADDDGAETGKQAAATKPPAEAPPPAAPEPLPAPVPVSSAAPAMPAAAAAVVPEPKLAVASAPVVEPMAPLTAQIAAPEPLLPEPPQPVPTPVSAPAAAGTIGKDWMQRGFAQALTELATLQPPVGQP